MYSVRRETNSGNCVVLKIRTDHLSSEIISFTIFLFSENYFPTQKKTCKHYSKICVNPPTSSTLKSDTDKLINNNKSFVRNRIGRRVEVMHSRSENSMCVFIEIIWQDGNSHVIFSIRMWRRASGVGQSLVLTQIHWWYKFTAVCNVRASVYSAAYCG